MTSSAPKWSLAFRLARREIRGGIQGLRVFVACLVLGVGAIAAVGSLTEAFRHGVEAQSRAILGGDVELSATLGDLSNEQQDWLATQGTVSRVVETRAMVRGLESDIRGLVELKAVDDAYPLVGQVLLETAVPWDDALSQRDGIWGAAVEPRLLPRLGLKVGDRLRIGELVVEIRALISREPDRVGAGFVLAPRVFLTDRALDETGLIQFGSQAQFAYRILLPDGVTPDDFKKAVDAFAPNAPWRVRDPGEGAISAQEFVDRVGLFFTFVALSTLLVGGVGVGNAVKGYLDGKTGSIAIQKTLGATGPLIFRSYLIQILLLSAVSILIGLAAGALTPNLVIVAFADALPIRPEVSVYPIPLLIALAYGLLVTLAFAIWPIARARDTSPAQLFRDVVASQRPWPRPLYVGAIIDAVAWLCVLGVLLTPYRTFALLFLAGAALLFLILRLEAAVFIRLAKALGRPRNPTIRLAITNLYRPGAPTASAVLSIGLGLTLLMTISLIDGNISAQLAEEAPERAPSFFMLDIRRDQTASLDALVESMPTASDYRRVAMIRAQIIEINGIPVDIESLNPDVRWVFQRERNLTYAATMPEGTVIARGDCWPENYDGPPAISLGLDIAESLNIGVGDSLTFDIVGRQMSAEIANLRDVDWDEGGAQFAVIFAPGALENAPQRHMATLRVDPSVEETVYNQVADRFPNITVIWVRDAAEAIGALLSELAVAVRAATSVTLLAGILVLAGALASGHRHRLYDAVILKVLGATRRRVLLGYVIEYALLGFGTALVSSLVAVAAAYLVITQVMDADWFWLPQTLITTVLAATLATIALGLIGTWRALGKKTAPVLRTQ